MPRARTPEDAKAGDPTVTNNSGGAASVTATPEPGTVALMAMGLLAFAGVRRNTAPRLTGPPPRAINGAQCSPHSIR